MSEPGQPNEPIATRNGIPVYRSNPSVPTRDGVQTRRRPVQVKGRTDHHAMLLNPDTGEVLGRASVAFWDIEEVDSTRFVKVFLEGIRQTVGLTKAGLTVFEWVYEQVRQNPGSDRITLTALEAVERGLAERTFNRGVRELVDKHFLFASPARGLYWLNIQYMFNGDRLHFVKSYRLKRRTQAVERVDGQHSLLPDETKKQEGETE